MVTWNSSRQALTRNIFGKIALRWVRKVHIDQVRCTSSRYELRSTTKTEGNAGESELESDWTPEVEHEDSNQTMVNSAMQRLTNGGECETFGQGRYPIRKRAPVVIG